MVSEQEKEYLLPKDAELDTEFNDVVPETLVVCLNTCLFL